MFKTLSASSGTANNTERVRIDTTVDEKQQATLIRQVSDWALDAAVGRRQDLSYINKYGHNTTVAVGTWEDIWSVGGDYSFLTSAVLLDVVSTSDNDDAAGTHCRSITITGLDADFNSIEEVVAMDGKVTVTTESKFLRVNRVRATTVGAYGNTNEGDIQIYRTGTTTHVAQVVAGEGSTQSTVYTVPAGKTACITQIYAQAASAKPMDFRVNIRTNADVVAAPYTATYYLWDLHEIETQVNRTYSIYPSFAAKTDIWMSAKGSTGGATGKAEGQFDLILYNN